ncbi:hypothetical protein BD560DRAFT_425737 [Blakeslea trispora]|nr:hypothetical protein BD560DRAFT_425737 [Blakeslea trispora]
MFNYVQLYSMCKPFALSFVGLYSINIFIDPRLFVLLVNEKIELCKRFNQSSHWQSLLMLPSWPIPIICMFLKLKSLDSQIMTALLPTKEATLVIKSYLEGAASSTAELFSAYSQVKIQSPTSIVVNCYMAKLDNLYRNSNTISL